MAKITDHIVRIVVTDEDAKPALDRIKNGLNALKEQAKGVDGGFHGMSGAMDRTLRSWSKYNDATRDVHRQITELVKMERELQKVVDAGKMSQVEATKELDARTRAMARAIAEEERMVFDSQRRMASKRGGMGDSAPVRNPRLAMEQAKWEASLINEQKKALEERAMLLFNAEEKRAADEERQIKDAEARAARRTKVAVDQAKWEAAIVNDYTSWWTDTMAKQDTLEAGQAKDREARAARQEAIQQRGVERAKALGLAEAEVMQAGALRQSARGGVVAGDPRTILAAEEAERKLRNAQESRKKIVADLASIEKQATELGVTGLQAQIDQERKLAREQELRYLTAKANARGYAPPAPVVTAPTAPGFLSSFGSSASQMNKMLDQRASIIGMLNDISFKMFVITFATKQMLDMFLTTFVQVGERMGTLRTRIEVLSGSTEVFDQLYKISQNLGVSVENLGGSFARFAVANKSVGLTNDELVSMTETIAKLGLIGGGTVQEISAGMQQLAQGFASGRLQGDELRSVFENLPLVAVKLAEGLNTTTAGLRRMATEGQLGPKAIQEALAKAEDSVNKMMENLPNTTERSLTRISDAWSRTIDEMLQSIGTSNIADAFDQIAVSLNGVANYADKNTARVGAFVKSLDDAAITGGAVLAISIVWSKVGLAIKAVNEALAVTAVRAGVAATELSVAARAGTLFGVAVRGLLGPIGIIATVGITIWYEMSKGMDAARASADKLAGSMEGFAESMKGKNAKILEAYMYEVDAALGVKKQSLQEAQDLEEKYLSTVARQRQAAELVPGAGWDKLAVESASALNNQGEVIRKLETDVATLTEKKRLLNEEIIKLRGGSSAAVVGLENLGRVGEEAAKSYDKLRDRLNKVKNEEEAVKRVGLEGASGFARFLDELDNIIKATPIPAGASQQQRDAIRAERKLQMDMAVEGYTREKALEEQHKAAQEAKKEEAAVDKLAKSDHLEGLSSLISKAYELNRAEQELLRTQQEQRRNYIDINSQLQDRTDIYGQLTEKVKQYAGTFKATYYDARTLPGTEGVTGFSPKPTAMVSPTTNGAPAWAKSLVDAVEQRRGLPSGALAGIWGAESNFSTNTGLLGPQTRYGRAVSPIQMLPSTATQYGVENIAGLPLESQLDLGARYLKKMLDQFKTLPLAYAAYNAGPGNVQKAGGIPGFKETQAYVPRALGYAGAGSLADPNSPRARTLEMTEQQKSFYALESSAKGKLPKLDPLTLFSGSELEQYNAALKYQKDMLEHVAFGQAQYQKALEASRAAESQGYAQKQAAQEAVRIAETQLKAASEEENTARERALKIQDRLIRSGAQVVDQVAQTKDETRALAESFGTMGAAQERFLLMQNGLNKLLASGAIDLAEYNRLLREQEKQLAASKGPMAEFLDSLSYGAVEFEKIVTGAFESFRDVLAESLVSGKFQIDGFLTYLKQAAAKMAADQVTKMLLGGIGGLVGLATGGTASASTSATPAGGSSTSFLSSILSLFGGNSMGGSSAATVARLAGMLGFSGNGVGAGVASIAQLSNWAFGAAGIGGGLMGSLLFPKSPYSGIGGSLGGTAGMIGGTALGGAMGGAMAGSMVFPVVGTIIGGLLGAFGGSLLGGGKDTTPEKEAVLKAQYEYKTGLDIEKQNEQIAISQIAARDDANTAAIAAQYEAVLQENLKRIAAIAKERADLELELSTLLGGEKRAREAQVNALDASNRPIKQMAYAFSDLKQAATRLQSQWQNMADSIDTWAKNAQATIFGSSEPSARDAYQVQLAAARAGDMEAIAGLTGYADRYLAAAKADASTYLDYQRAAARVLGDVSGVGKQAQSAADRLADITGETNKTLQEQYALALKSAQEALAYYESSGVYDSAILDQLKRLNLGSRSTTGFADGGISTGPTSGYDVTLHGTEAVIPLKDGAVPVAISWDGMLAELRALGEELRTLRHEQKGQHQARVVQQQETSEEIRALRQEQQRQHHASFTEQRDTADVLRRWEVIGQPEVRTV